MVTAKSLNEILALAMINEAAALMQLKKVVVPWSREMFPPISAPSEEGFYPGYFPPVYRTDNLESMKQLPEAFKVVFDLTGDLYTLMYTHGDAAEAIMHVENGLVGIVLGKVPEQALESDQEAKLVIGTGVREFTPQNWYVYLLVYTNDKKTDLGFMPRLSGRLPLTDDRPIFYYARPEQIGLMVPEKHAFDFPPKFIISLS